MITELTIANRVLQVLGTRTTMTLQEYNQGLSNEAIQMALILVPTRDDLLRMAPWDCCTATDNLAYVTSLPGTPENQSPGLQQWARGIPAPPWTYEYAYPRDCLRAVEILISADTGFPGVPIFPTGNGYAPIYPGPAVRFKVATDRLYPVISAAVATPGTGYSIGDVITLANAAPPVGAPAQLLVNGTTPASGVSAVEPLQGFDVDTGDFTTDYGPTNPTDYHGFAAGGYFQPLKTPQAQASTTGSGSGATFNLTFGPRTNMRVILTNQPQAMLRYNQRIYDPNAMDSLFITAWIEILAARLCMALTGDKAMANQRIQLANAAIMTARGIDGNESPDRVDSMPDWITIRGGETLYFTGGFDWGPLWPSV